MVGVIFGGWYGVWGAGYDTVFILVRVSLRVWKIFFFVDLLFYNFDSIVKGLL